MKNQIVQLMLVLFFCKTTLYFGQYTTVINSNRPGFSESPYSLGTGVYQLESSFFYRNTEANSLFTRPENLGVDLLFRTGLMSEKLELNVNFVFQQDKIAFTNIFQSSTNQTLVRQFLIAAKYLLYQPTYTNKSKEVRSWKRKFDYDYNRLIPAIAVYAGVNSDAVNSFYQVGGVAPRLGVLLQQNFTPDFNLINNLYYDNIGTQFSKYTYIITGTQNFGNRFSSFLEYKGDFFDVRYDHSFGTGLAYLFNRDFQLNASGRFLFEGKTKGFFASVGASYRIDNHKDAFKDLDNVDYLKEETPIEKYNRKQNGFFKRIFGSKKKTDRKKATRKRIKVKKRKARKRKPKKDKKKKEETEIEKLEREIKELEQEMKKGGNE